MSSLPSKNTHHQQVFEQLHTKMNHLHYILNIFFNGNNFLQDQKPNHKAILRIQLAQVVKQKLHSLQAIRSKV